MYMHTATSSYSYMLESNNSTIMGTSGGTITYQDTFVCKFLAMK